MVRLASCLALLLGGVATAAPAKAAYSPTVTIKNGTIVGTSDYIVDSFKGIPFAQPPVGGLRLKPPLPLNQSFGTIQSQAIPTSCPQFYTSVNSSILPEKVLALLLDTPFAQEVTEQGEDCLTINVQRPAGTTASSKLPVVVWFWGGGFEFGNTQLYDGSLLITQSMALGYPVVFVTGNYRVGGFGFLAGNDLSQEGSTNLGLRDQRLHLQWVQDNIAAFGGDPTKVTIWGESAGSISVADHTIINGGDNTYNGKPLFRGAMMDSGSIVPALTTTSGKAQAVYNQVVSAAGCSSSNNRLACLRALSYSSFLNAVNSVPGLFDYSSLDISYLPRPDPGSNFFPQSPEIPISQGKFAKVPIIVGDQQDEGTLFALVQQNISNTNDLVNYLSTYFSTASPQIVAGLVATYPDNPSAGSPYNTGTAWNIYPEFKRLAAILGDITFTLTRRGYLNYVSGSVPSWSYLSSYFYGVPILGTFHASDLLQVFGDFGSPIPTYSIQTYYISFVNFLDPNKISTSSPLIQWPNWTKTSPKLMDFSATQNTIIPDTFRQSSYQYIAANIANLRV